MFDSGSQQSYITESLAQDLSLPSVGRQSLTVMTFGAADSQSHICERVKLELELKDGQTTQITLYTTPLICKPLSYQPISLCQDKFEHVMDLDLADASGTHSHLDVDIFIGSDQYWNFITGEVRRGSFGPVAVNTKFGWVLSGPTVTDDNCQTSASLLTHSLVTNKSSELQCQDDDHLQRFWDLESLGILPLSVSHPSVQEQFDNTVCFVDGRYQVCLPWKEAHSTLNDHLSLCLNRLEKLMNRLCRQPNILRDQRTTTPRHCGDSEIIF